MNALLTARPGKWQHCASTGRDAPVGMCHGDDCGELVYSAWCFFEDRPGQLPVKVVVLCDDCAEEALNA